MQLCRRRSSRTCCSAVETLLIVRYSRPDSFRVPRSAIDPTAETLANAEPLERFLKSDTAGIDSPESRFVTLSHRHRGQFHFDL
jgi:hypothetical protein